MKNYIDAAAFKEMILCADAALTDKVSEINDLNVFPVPDGDTGTNMSLTLNKAAQELRKKSFETASSVADCTASALLRGARGNSGVILSLLFRGISRRMKGQETVGAAEFAAALQDGVDSAYKAVMKPAEGTILTVSRLSAEAAVQTAAAGGSLESCISCAVKSGEEALENTLNLNPVLKKAGVVDAGGKGYVVILKAMLSSLRGEVASPREGKTAVAMEDSSAFEAFDTADITYAFDTVFIVRKKDGNVDLDPLREYLSSIGDCLVIGEDDESFKVHVHTNIPGNALNKSQEYGTLELAKIENMRTQHDDILAGRKPQSTDDLDEVERSPEEQGSAEPEKEYGIVTVCAGAGLENLFRELGADGVVTGGQTMNPSTDDILCEINRTPASTVFVFPNNKNIIMAAEQCVPLTDKRVIVMPTKTVPQGISALLNFDPDEQAEALRDTMMEAAGAVHTAMITYAARDSDFDGHQIHAGEYLALLDGALIGSYTSLKTLFKELSWSLDELSPELITLYYGADVAREDAEEYAEALEGCFPEADVNVVNGGQPVYYYMISIE